MSIEVFGLGPGTPKLTVAWDEEPGVLEIVASMTPRDTPRTYMVIRVPTKALVMAIKQVEEERDAEFASDGSHSKRSGLPKHERSLTEAIHRGEEELRRMFRGAERYSTYDKEMYEYLRFITSARSPEEVDDILWRVKEKYLRPDRFPPWR